MDVNVVREVVTVVSFAAFGAIVWWAVSPGNAGRFEDAARMPLEDE